MSVSERPSDRIESLRRDLVSCQACPLWKDAAETIFGAGRALPPSRLLRLQDEVEKRVGYASLMSDLRSIGRLAEPSES
jgi:hypothetical protein